MFYRFARLSRALDVVAVTAAGASWAPAANTAKRPPTAWRMSDV
jgi:hypothetical protein